MVVPPLTVTREEAEEGVAILDDVLSIADEYVDLTTAEQCATARPTSTSRRLRQRRNAEIAVAGLLERVPQHRVPAREP